MKISPALVITKHTMKERGKVAVALGYMAGVVTLTSTYGYKFAYPLVSDRLRLSASFSRDAGIAAVFGPARSLETVAGFVAFRTLGVIPLIIAIWASLTATKALRGNEDTGRWEILISSRVTKRYATMATIRGLFASLTISLVLASVIIAFTARLSHDFSIRSSFFFSLTLFASGYLFIAVGSLASQLVNSKRSASTMTGITIGLSFLIRAVADSSPSISWIHWFSPFGWITQSAPLTHPSWWGLALTLVTTLTLLIITLTISEHRDLNGSVFSERASNHVGMKLTGVTKLWLRLQSSSITNWILGLFFISFAFGLVLHGATKAFSGSSTIKNTFSDLGISNTSDLFLGIIFLMLTAGLMFAANGFATSLREQEAEGFMDHLLVAPISRTRILLSRIIVSICALVLTAIAAGLGAFAGSGLRNGTLALADALSASINIVPSTLLLFGISIAVFGISPRATAIVGQSLLAWSFLLELIGSALKLNHWFMDTSLLHHMAFAPAVAPRWGENGILLLISTSLIGLGFFSFNRRDTAIG